MKLRSAIAIYTRIGRETGQGDRCATGRKSTTTWCTPLAALHGVANVGLFANQRGAIGQSARSADTRRSVPRHPTPPGKRQITKAKLKKGRGLQIQPRLRRRAGRRSAWGGLQALVLGIRLPFLMVFVESMLLGQITISLDTSKLRSASG